ncbi:MAG: hypothetical protein EP347_06760 [Alphaproteobacteria bacterium]|nr:MAG: hypothetical protein EP347_06760 [Alphaproteobacteria bacterium]
MALSVALRKAIPGDTISLAQGIYNVTDLEIDKSIALRGEGKVTLRSDRSVRKGLFVTRRGVSLLVDGLIFEGASSQDRNGAGIRHQGSHLVVLNSVFHRNEDGILATADGSGDLIIRNSRFLGNGYGDGYSHGIYVQKIKTLTVTDSLFSGTKVGHHIKSMAGRTFVQTSQFDDHGGMTSYSIEVAGGGDFEVSKCHFQRDGNAGNNTVIFYSANRGGVPGRLRITSNSVVSEKQNTIFFKNKTRVPAVMEGNHLYNRDSGKIRLHVGPAIDQTGTN